MPTEDFANSLKDNFVNVGVVAALLLTLISVTDEGPGNKLEPYVAAETAGQIFAALSTVALLALFTCVLHCLITYFAISELNCLEEVVTWSQIIGAKLHLHYACFCIGFIVYIVSQLWLAITILDLAIVVPIISVFLVFVTVPIWATTRSVQALYIAKIKLAEKYPKDGGGQ